MAKNAPLERGRITSMSTPRGRLIHLDFRPGEQGLERCVVELGNRQPEDYVLATTARQLRRRGGRRLLPESRDVLSLAILLHPPMHVTRSGIITVSAAAAACRVLEKNTALQPSIEWVNNVVAEERRVAAFHLGGMLQQNGFWEYLVLSCAISLQPEDYEDKLSDLVTRVFSNRSSDVADRVTEEFLAEFFSLYENASGDHLFATEYNKRARFIGQRTRAQVNGRWIRARAEGINENGQLMVSNRKGLFTVTDLSKVRGLY